MGKRMQSSGPMRATNSSPKPMATCGSLLDVHDHRVVIAPVHNVPGGASRTLERRADPRPTKAQRSADLSRCPSGCHPATVPGLTGVGV